MLGRIKSRLTQLAIILALLALVAAPLRAQSQTPAGGTGWRNTLDQVLNEVRSRYKDPVDESALLKGAIRGALEALADSHSAFMVADEYLDFMNSIEGEVSGIGVFIEKQGDYITVISPIRGGPAERAGLRTGDRIIAAGDEQLVGVPLERAAKTIRGKPGTAIKITVERQTEGRTFSIEVIRAHLSVPVVEQALLVRGIGYIKVNSFSEDAPQRVTEAVRQLNDANVRGMILDLRGNPGGLLGAAIDVAGVFLPKGTKVVEVAGRDKQPETFLAYGPGATVPLAVLVDKGSASASEIVAGALQDHGRAIIVGEKTFGKGTVQNLIQLGDQGFLKLTVAEYRTPKGRKVDGQGIQPDVIIAREQPDSKRTEELKFERLLMRGNVGLDVLAVQQRVNDLGYYLGQEDGYYGGALILAIQALQRAAGLEVHGMVDRPTLAKLNEKAAAHALALREQDAPKDKAAEILHDRAKVAATP